MGPTTCIRPAAGLRAHRRQPKGRAGAIWRRRSQGNRNRAFGPAYAAAATTLRTGAREAVPQWGIRRRRKRPERVKRSKRRAEETAMPAAPTELAEPAPARLLRAISCRTASGTGRGAGMTGTGRAHLGPGSHATRVGPIRREAPTCLGTDKRDTGRREAKRERRPADGVGYRQGWAQRSNNIGEVGRRPNRAITCRTASGTGRGAGSRPAGLSRVGPIRRVSAIPAATPNMPLFGRSAQRRPADGC